jgi:hypothetical protein
MEGSQSPVNAKSLSRDDAHKAGNREGGNGKCRWYFFLVTGLCIGSLAAQLISGPRLGLERIRQYLTHIAEGLR